MKLYIPKEEDYFKSYSKELEEYIEKLEHENERIYTRLDDNDKEIERLNKENQILMNSMVTEAHTKETKEIERLNNIIKEVREYIQDRYDGEVLTHTFDKDNVGELLEILKGSEKE